MGNGARGGSGGAAPFDHPILQESLAWIRSRLGTTGLSGIEQEVLERVVHAAGDPGVAVGLRFSPGACRVGLKALTDGAPILTDTAMAAAAVRPMAGRTFGTPVHCLLEWAPERAPAGSTRSAAGMGEALRRQQGAVVLIGSAPTALECLLELSAAGGVAPPALVIGMPVGFVGVRESKRRLAASDLPQIRLEGTRGGAGMAAAAANALLRRAWLDQAA